MTGKRRVLDICEFLKRRDTGICVWVKPKSYG